MTSRTSATEVVDLLAWEALDSRGHPTVACEVLLAGGARGVAMAPAGASTGRHEVAERRDGGDRYGGRGVTHAVAAVEAELAVAVVGLDGSDQAEIDRSLRRADGTPTLERLGANGVLAVSVAVAIAAAEANGVPLHRWLAGNGAEPLLPMPMVNIVSGGAHAGGAIDVQDLLVVPVGANSFTEALEWASRVRRATVEVADELGLLTALVADEGGLGPPLPSNRAGLELLVAGMERSGLSLGDDVAIAIDVAANQMWSAAGYRLATEERLLDAGELIDELGSWCADFPIISVEDPLTDDDWSGWREATSALGDRVQLVGDDLFVTDADRVRQGIVDGVANAVLVKPNQTGTLSSATAVVDLARDAGYATIVSARSGETEECWLADLAVGWRAGQIKVGSLTRSERTAKWNRLLRIERESEGATFAGRSALAATTPPSLWRGRR